MTGPQAKAAAAKLAAAFRAEAKVCHDTDLHALARDFEKQAAMVEIGATVYAARMVGKRP